MRRSRGDQLLHAGITVLIVPGLLIVVGLWQAGHLASRARVWVREHVLG